MDWIWIISGSVLMLAGLLGAFLPVIPGPPLSYIGLILLQLTSNHPFSTRFLSIWALVTILITLLDYIVPIWGTRQFGGSKMGIWGSTIGLLIGLFFFPPLGIIVGPFLGAVVGELISGRNTEQAMRAGFGSFLGFLAGTLMKLSVSLIMTYHFVVALVR